MGTKAGFAGDGIATFTSFWTLFDANVWPGPFVFHFLLLSDVFLCIDVINVEK